MTQENVHLRDLSFGNGSTRDILNDHSAKSAGVAVKAYADYLGLRENVDFESIAVSLLCDLIHLADRNDLMMRKMLLEAEELYDQEIGDD